METSQSKSLSPAAQAVKDAALAMYADCNIRRLAWPLDMPVVAAALRAVADQVVPDQRGDGVYLTGTDYHRWHERKLIRRQLLAIAAELEGSVTYNPPEDNEMGETQWTMLMN
jgi:hypothetical protein